MAYTLVKSNGTDTITILDNSIDNADTSLLYVGRNSRDYGTAIAQNILRQLENFASDLEPENNPALSGGALTGQLWYDSGNHIMNHRKDDTWVELIDRVTISDDSFLVANATRLENDLTINLSSDATGSVSFKGDEGSVTLNVDLNQVIDSDTTGNAATADYATQAGNATTANRLANSRTIQVSGAVSGSTSFDGSQNVNISVSASPTLTITGDATGSATFSNLANSTLTLSLSENYYTETEVDNLLDSLETDLTNDLSVSGGTGITVSSSNVISVNDTVVRTSGSQSIGGSKTFTSGITAPSYSTSSDLRLKKNISPIHIDMGALSNIDLVEWEWKSNSGNMSGVIAQEIEKIEQLRHCVKVDYDGYRTVDYGLLATHLVLSLIENLKRDK